MTEEIWQIAVSRKIKLGRPPAYETPEQLLEVAFEYFEYIKENPLKEQRVFSTGKRQTLDKMRAMTIQSFCLFAGISRVTFDAYRDKQSMEEAVQFIRDVIYSQKFEGAAADLLNSNIIARDLKLAEINEHTGKDGAPLVSPAEELKKMLDAISKRD